MVAVARTAPFRRGRTTSVQPDPDEGRDTPIQRMPSCTESWSYCLKVLVMPIKNCGGAVYFYRTKKPYDD